MVTSLGNTCISSPSKSNLSTIFDINGTLRQAFAMRNRDLNVNLINLTLISEKVMLIMIKIPLILILPLIIYIYS